MNNSSGPPERESTLLDSSSQAEMDELRRAYGSSLPGKLLALGTAVHSVVAAPAEEAALRSAISLAHRLRGTAGSYGYDKISTTGGAIEDLLRGWTDADSAQRQIMAIKLERLLQEATHEIPDPVEHNLAAGAPKPRRINLLVVNEQPAFNERLGAASEANNVNLVWACTVEQALQQVRDRSVNAALIGLHWHGIGGGIPLARELRAATGDDGLPLLLIADAATDEDRTTAIYLGASQTLYRSESTGELFRAIRDAVEGQVAARPHILVVDDDPEFAALTCATIEGAGMRATLLADASEVRETLTREHPELLLLDVDMPSINGFDLCRMLRLDPRWQELSILFLTARTDPSSRVAAFEVGGDDYIPKPVVTLELLARIRARIERWRLLRERADRDALTGLYLRRHFTESFGAALSACLSKGTPLSVVILDLDHFKMINDRHGHLAGDHVLARLGSLLGASFRRGDLRGRWGGEEFVLAFPGVDGGCAAGAAMRALEDFRQLDFLADGGQLFRASFSGGVATYPEDGATLDALLRVADQRLYDAKSTGRGRVLYAAAQGSTTGGG